MYDKCYTFDFGENATVRTFYLNIFFFHMTAGIFFLHTVYEKNLVEMLYNYVLLVNANFFSTEESDPKTFINQTFQNFQKLIKMLTKMMNLLRRNYTVIMLTQ